MAERQGLSLIHRISNSTLQTQVQRMPDRFYNLIDYWTNQQKTRIEFEINGENHGLDIAYAPRALLNTLHKGERFGSYVGDITLIDAETARTHPTWVPYIAFKLYTERLVEEGEDKSGLVKHIQSLRGTLRLAGKTMNESDFKEFLDASINWDSSGMSDLFREDYERFMEGSSGDVLVAKRNYLEKHHNNRWVRRGRIVEELVSLGLDDSGYGSRADAIIKSVPDFDLENRYLFAEFVNRLNNSEDNRELRVSPPFNSFAYALTKDANGVVDMVKFQESNDPTSIDIIKKISNLGRAWTSLSKRVSYLIHTAEIQAGEVAEEQRRDLEGVLFSIESTNQEAKEEIERLRDLSVSSPLSDLSSIIRALSGEYTSTIQRLDSEAEKIIDNLSSLELLSRSLEGRI